MTLLFLSLIFYFKPVFTNPTHEIKKQLPQVQAFKEISAQQDIPKEMIESSDIQDQFIPLEQIDDLEQEAKTKPPILRKQSLSFKAYTVRKGDSLYRIAKNHRISVDTIISKNKLKPLEVLMVGKKLSIPTMDGLFHTVKKQETVSSISRKFKVEIKHIREHLSNKSQIRSGQTIFIPGASLSRSQKELLFGGFFINPVKGYLTSRYGVRFHPIKKKKLFHSGVDIGGNDGVNVKATASGVVVFAGAKGSYGNYIKLKHAHGYESSYAHLKSIQIKVGQKIKRGQKIGIVGNTGLSTGPHLHFELKQHGRFINPLRFIKVPGQSKKSRA